MSEQAPSPPTPTAEEELERFDREWRIKHPRQLVNMDRDYDKPEPHVFVSRSQMIQDGIDYASAKRAFIRTNPIIQARLAAEVKRKAEPIKNKMAAAVILTAIVNRTAKKGSRT